MKVDLPLAVVALVQLCGDESLCTPYIIVALQHLA
jgi:hypothetical protein